MTLFDCTFHLRRISGQANLAPWLAVALVFATFVSVTATGLIAGLLFAVFLLRGDFQALRRYWRDPVVLSLAGLLVLFPLGALWSDAPVPDMFDHAGSYLKLVFLPVLAFVLARAMWPERALLAALAGLVVLVSLSVLHFIWPDAPFWPAGIELRGVPLRTYTLMNIGCAVAAHALAYIAYGLRTARPRLSLALAGLAVMLVCHILFIVPSRTGVIVLFVLSVLLCFQLFQGRKLFVSASIVLLLAGAGYIGAPKVQQRFQVIFSEIDTSSQTGSDTSSGLRMVYWTKALSFVGERPLLGHGTGSIRMLYARDSGGGDTIADAVTADPHNQALALMLPFGLLGLAALAALWGSHLQTFWGSGFYAASGQAMVLQNMVAGLFNSHLAVFDLGWFYVVVTGTLLAAVLRGRRRQRQVGQALTPCFQELRASR